MKNQYFGDVNDYKKYGLLRILGRRSDLSLGVCWLLTGDDERKDGQRRSYLKKLDRHRDFDPDLYDKLLRLPESGIAPSVLLAQEWALLPKASYFEKELDDGAKARDAYFEAAWTALQTCQLLFFDPDNGLEVPSTKRGTRGSAKYLYWQELREAYSNGHSVLVYQHFPHVQHESFVRVRTSRIAKELQGAYVMGLETAHVSFFLAAQPAHVAILRCAAEEVEAAWPGQIWLRCDAGPA